MRHTRLRMIVSTPLLPFAYSLALSFDATAQAVSAPALPPTFDFLEATIFELQSALATGTVTSQALVEMYLARVAAYDQRGPALNAVSALNPDALAEAVALDAERATRGPRGPLHGIPVIVKDNYETLNMQTAAGSRALAGWLPGSDAFLVTRLKRAGAIIIAKANMHEFAYGITTVGSLFGQTRNPYALECNPGGSSGGTGAAIAANFATVGMGSDTCGSIRIPASHNSLVGLRGTQGLLSRTGIIPLSHTQDIGGPIGRNVTDVAIVLDVIAGYDEQDPQTAESVGNIPKRYTEFLQADGLRGARIGLLTDLLEKDAEDAEVATVVRKAATEMKAQGAEVVEVTIPALDILIKDRFDGFLVSVEEFKFDLNAYLALQPTAPVRSLAQILESGKYHPMVEKGLRDSQNVESLDTKEYLEHVVKRATLKQAILQTMADHRLDALAYPTIRRKAAPIGQKQTGTNCHLSANSGLPAISVPAGFTADGFPVGVELLGRAWNEPVLLKLAYSYEQATHHRRPPASTPVLSPAQP